MTDISLKKSDNDAELTTVEIAQNQKDFTIYKSFLERSIDIDLEGLYSTVLKEDADSVIFLYSTENVNYLQRKIAFQYNLAVDTLLKDERVNDKIHFYAYDAYKYGFPKGIPKRSGPP